MMVKRSVFEKVGGFDEELAVALNDVDLCLKIRREKQLIVMDPGVQLYHYESKSRDRRIRRQRWSALRRKSAVSAENGRRFWKRETPTITRI